MSKRHYLCTSKIRLMRFSVLLLFSWWLFPTIIQAQTPIRLQGSVLDATTGKPMPFVYIIVNQGEGVSQTDLQGRFDFLMHVSVERVLFTHVGYEDFEYFVNAPEDLQPLQRPLHIALNPKTTALPAVEIAYQNPAHRLIREALRNRQAHNPKRLPFYSYDGYTKYGVSADTTKAKLPRATPKDSADYKFAVFSQQNYLFFSESVTRYLFRAPNFQHETVLANRVAGIQNPQLIAFGTQGQWLNFYEDYFTVLDRKFLNPISAEAWKHYRFVLEDSVILKPDTLFWVSFAPLPNKNFDGLSGRLAIHSRNFAIQSMEIASCLPPSETGVSFQLQQQFEWIDKKRWFPKKARIVYTFHDLKIAKRKMVMFLQTDIAHVDFEKKPPLAEFRDVSLTINADAHQQPAELWEARRAEPLTNKEQNTYTNLDTLGKRLKLDKRLAYVQYLPFGRVPIKQWKVDFDLPRAIAFNRYEVMRLGAGVWTNDRFSTQYALGSYLAYGVRDGRFKYGISAQYRPFAHLDASVSASYTNDILEPARVRLSEETIFSPNANRQLFAFRMDKIRQFELKAQGKPLQNVRAEWGISTREILPAYAYTYQILRKNGDLQSFSNGYQTSEISLQVQASWGAQYVRWGSLRSLTAVEKPSVSLSYARGVRLFGGDFSYSKWQARITHAHTFRHIGTTEGELWLGLATGELPYQAIWNGQGLDRTLPYLLPNFFQTMGMYEFLSDRFMYVFIRHNFRKLLYKSPYEWLQPEFALHHSFAWGGLRNPDAHQGIETKTLNKGFWETGIVANDVLKKKYDFIRVGLCLGIFARYGAYRNQDNFGKNLAYKFGLNVSF